ncbi:hypothetical protein PG985_014990 [Apiospora marii]|uniref:Fungal N-terminal domain-containing protein n=1 Tax=Apiospora marii TaxID=335849 RepID=A0ABR1RIN5_9PEZI
MEPLGTAAAIAQLLAYSNSAGTILLELITHLRTGSAGYEERIQELEALQGVLKDLPHSVKAQSSIDLVIRSIIQVSQDAVFTLKTLKKKHCILGTFLWACTERSRISNYFSSLDSKKRDLVLYLVQDHSRTLRSIDARLPTKYTAKKMSKREMLRDKDTSGGGQGDNLDMGSNTTVQSGVTTITSKGSTVEEFSTQSTGVANNAVSSDAPAPSNIDASDTMVRKCGASLVGYRTETEAVDIHRLNLQNGAGHIVGPHEPIPASPAEATKRATQRRYQIASTSTPNSNV